MENHEIKGDINFVKLTRIWVKALVCVIITLILALSVYHGYRTYRIGKAIEKGHDPVVARIAFSYGTHERLVYLSGNKHILDQQKLLKTKK